MNIPALIAAIAFAVFVVICAIPLWKLGKVFDEMRTSVRSVADNTNKTIAEAAKTVQGANEQLDKLDAITTSTAQVTQDISAMSTLLSATVAAPFIKIAAFSQATRKMFNKGDKE